MPIAQLSYTNYFGPFYGHPSIGDEERANAGLVITAGNTLLNMADKRGVRLLVNPATKSPIGGQYNGGYRPPESSTGAAKSKHKRALAVDLYDPYRDLAAFICRNRAILKKFFWYIEDPRWTPTWLHLQVVPPGTPPNLSRYIFIPDASAPRADPLPLAEGCV